MPDQLARAASPATLRRALAIQRAHLRKQETVIAEARELHAEARALVAVAFSLLGGNAGKADQIAGILGELRRLVSAANLTPDIAAAFDGPLTDALRVVWEISDSVEVMVGT